MVGCGYRGGVVSAVVVERKRAREIVVDRKKEAKSVDVGRKSDGSDWS